jgi:hypothetical protein
LIFLNIYPGKYKILHIQPSPSNLPENSKKNSLFIGA